MSSFVHNVVESSTSSPPPPRHIMSALFSQHTTDSPLHRPWTAPHPPTTTPTAATTQPSTTASTATASPPPPLSQSQPVSSLLSILDLEELDTLLYRGYSPPHPRWGRVYGGQTVSQALIAASRTIRPPFIAHSLHSYFLRPGNDNLPVVYQVECMHDGHSFASRRVTASQRGKAIFICMISFQRPEHGHLHHQDTMPAVPAPDELPSLVQTMQTWAQDERLSESVRAGIIRSSSFPFPIDLRRVDNHELSTRLSPQQPLQRCWMRVTGQLSHHSIVHQCALAYMSDWSILETALLPHGIHSYQNTAARQLQMASLDHSLYFHAADLRADEWLLYVMVSEWAGGGRGLTRGQFYDQRGRLIVSVVQEGLVRLRIAGQVQWSDSDSGSGSSGTASQADGEREQSTHGQDSKAKQGREQQRSESSTEQGQPTSSSKRQQSDDGVLSGAASSEKKQAQSPSNHFTVLPAKL